MIKSIYFLILKKNIEILTLKRPWGGGIKTLHVWRLPILTGMKFGLSNLHVIFIFGVWNNRVKGILVVDFKNLKNFDFEKKKFFSGLRQKYLKIQFSLIFSKILIEFYFLRSNLNLECVQLSFDVHIVYLSQNWKFPTILIDVTSFKNVQNLVTCRIQLVAPVWPAGVLAGVQWPLEWYFTKIL